MTLAACLVASATAATTREVVNFDFACEWHQPPRPTSERSLQHALLRSRSLFSPARHELPTRTVEGNPAYAYHP
jgi:hypothetical protein